MDKTSELFKIDRQSRQPLYDQIEQNLRELILDGQLGPGELMPSEWELAEIYGVSRLTVRRALDNLARQNWLNRRHGVGTFIGKPAVAAIAPSKLSFSEQMRTIGRTPSSRLVSNQVVPASARIASRLRLREGDPLVEITRLRLADGIPLLLETAYLSKARYPDLEGETCLEAESLYDYLSQRYQVNVALVDETIKPVLLTESEAAHLEAEPGAPSIFSEIVAYTADGQPVEYSRSVSNSENSEFYFRFHRLEAGN
jgi:GntR family transcriptional regulator